MWLTAARPWAGCAVQARPEGATHVAWQQLSAVLVGVSPGAATPAL